MPWQKLADKVKALFDAGLMDPAIAVEIGCPTFWIPKALKYWCAVNNTTLKELRRGRQKSPGKPTKAMRLVEAAKQLSDTGMKRQDIATELASQFAERVGHDDVTRALTYWYTSRGFGVPDGREERKQFRLLREAEEEEKAA